MPLFEPMEYEYNNPLCEQTFNILLRSGAFGSPFDMPQSLRGTEVTFEFESPLHDATAREKGQRFLEAKAMLADAIALDPSTAYLVDVKVALREVLDGIGVPAAWTRSEQEVQQAEERDKQARQTAELLKNMQQGADVAKTLGEAGAAQGMNTNIRGNLNAA